MFKLAYEYSKKDSISEHYLVGFRQVTTSTPVSMHVCGEVKTGIVGLKRRVIGHFVVDSFPA